MKAVPAGAGRKARRASDRLRFRAIAPGGRTARANAHDDAMQDASPCASTPASVPPARLRRTAIRPMRVTRRPLKKRTRICGCDMS
ncbi:MULTISPECIES: hypothetical protein [Burkholderia]|uniref:hypothetical protein n=1 Tax=Burkholderia TaxID=32008 RepID=UPI000A77A51E|nr:MULTISPECIES: hypothetical protein [Burkholderia]QRR17121.1 hypothetical protein GJG85_27765 [Burkholderia sp. MS389]QVN11539.1 hypothetical protein JYG37_19970 [Burkholderia sp. LAS2]